MKQLRYLQKPISAALNKKMIFIGGPRQVGKTTLSLEFIQPKSVKNPSYLNWDRVSDRSLILKDQLPLQQSTLIFDEIHKYKYWRNLMKGLFDKHHVDHRFIVTGSARLDYFRKGGDSLLGRYRYFRLHPFSITEYKNSPTAKDLESLLKFSGFPESLFGQEERDHRIWQKERMNRVISEDLRDLENVREISQIMMLAEALPDRVGAPLSLRSLSEDLGVSQPTVDRWVQHLSNLYYCFRISPFGSPRIRAVKKLSKVYLWDWSAVDEKGFRFENLVASHLLKFCHFVEDTEGHTMELRYLRDTDLREIDFVVLKNKKPLFAVECKTGERQPSPSLRYFQERTNIPKFYQVHLGEDDYGSERTGRVLPFIRFFKDLSEEYGPF
ncbi:MAG: ATP-binding protein [Bdellovibrionaceae bacterium]|nr:ATP-binding protein [Pseudobdellovibrionaceae bacterium]